MALPDPEALTWRMDFHTMISLMARDHKALRVVRRGGNVDIECHGKNLIVPIPGGIQGQPLFPTEQEAEQCQIRWLITEDELLKA